MKNTKKLYWLKPLLIQISIVFGWIALIIIFLFLVSGYSLMDKAFLGIKLERSLARSIHYHSELYLLISLIIHIGAYYLAKYIK